MKPHPINVLSLAVFAAAPAALAQVSGVGAAKLERYGEAVLAVVAAAGLSG